MIHLSAHSNYTFLRSTVSPEMLIDKAVSCKMNSIALTDTNGMYGLIEFYKYANEKGIKPILGCYLVEDNENPVSCTLLARNLAGYSRICELITLRNLEPDFSIIKELKKNSNNIIIITSSLEIAGEFKKHKNLYLEMFYSPKRKKILREIYNFALENKIKFTAVNPVYFPDKDDYQFHKVVSAIRLNKTISDLTPDELESTECWFKSEEELLKVWKSLPEAITSTEEISSLCNTDLQLGKYKHPLFPLKIGETPFSFLWKIAFEGLSEKYSPLTEQVIKRLQEELHIIDELGFSDYFLIVWDIARQAKKMGMMSLGRGSAANSLVAYALGLTQVDPIKYKLYFERFLNLGRSSPPDIDLDFSWKERDAIVKYVYDKYGYDHVAFISTINTFRARSAFREVAKTFGISENEISEYTKFIPWTSAANLPYLSEKFPETRHLKFDTEPWLSIVSYAQRLSGYPRHLGIHPGGIVISPDLITKYTALEYADNKGLGLIITQPDMYSIEEMGLVKIDLLSQRSLAVVKDTMKKISSEIAKEEEKAVKIFRLK